MGGEDVELHKLLTWAQDTRQPVTSGAYLSTDSEKLSVSIRAGVDIVVSQPVWSEWYQSRFGPSGEHSKRFGQSGEYQSRFGQCDDQSRFRPSDEHSNWFGQSG